MSVTTSTNTVSQSALRLLADYELHHSEELAETEGVQPQNPRPEVHTDIPESWPTEYRRVPARRPIDRTLDRDLRPAGSFLVETCFIMTMLGGVTVNANVATLWRNTAGRLNDRVFRYPIGGEK